MVRGSPDAGKGQDGRNLVYVRPKSGMKLTMKELENYCERTYNMHYGEMTPRAGRVYPCGRTIPG